MHSLTDEPLGVEPTLTCDLNAQRQLEVRAQAELEKSAYSAVRRLSCSVQAGVITLHGQVPSFYLKQVAQRALLRLVEGLVTVDNQLQVTAPLRPFGRTH